MTDLRKAADMALEALLDLRRSESDQVWLDRWNDTIDALRAALEQEKKWDLIREMHRAVPEDKT